MPACARSEVLLFCLLAAALACAGCAPGNSRGSFEIEQLEAHWQSGHLNVRGEQTLQLSREARNALQHGVPLAIELQLVLRNAASHEQAGGDVEHFEIRYLPLSEHYQVTRNRQARVRTFPRLRHALGDVAEFDVTIETGILPAGDYELLARSRLDHRSMPAPMRLPALFDPDWRHSSHWVSRPLVIEPGA